MAEERIYTIPLRREFMKAPSYRKTKRALNAIKDFLTRHMKAEEIKIGKYLNLELWKHGRKNPPARIKIKAVKDTVKIKDKDIIIVKAELINAPIEVVKEEKKEVKKEGKLDVQEKALEEKIEKLEEEKKEVLEHEKIEHKERKTRSFVDKTKSTQKEKRSGVIGSTGKK